MTVLFSFFQLLHDERAAGAGEEGLGLGRSKAIFWKAAFEQAMRTLVDGGFVPESVISAVTTGDMTKLTHSGLVATGPRVFALWGLF